MQFCDGQIIALVDTKERQIGQIRFERQEGDLMVGTFVPGFDFPCVEQLFHDFEEAVDLQALHRVDELDAEIAALGLHVHCPDVSARIPVQDVQIWRDGGITCRLCRQIAIPS